MVNSFQGEYKRTLAAKLHKMGGHGEFPPDKAERISRHRSPVRDTAVNDIHADPERCLRETQLLSRDPIKAAKQLYAPKEVK
jgi:hypothetical protein